MSRRWRWRRWTNTGNCTKPRLRPWARTKRITKRNLWPGAGSGQSRRTRRAKSGFRWPDWMDGRPAARLPHQPAHSQTGGRNLRLDENGGRIEAQPLSRSGTDAGLGLFRGRDLQFAADNQSGIEFAGRMKDAVDQWAAQIGRKTRSKQPSGASAEQKSALHSDQIIDLTMTKKQFSQKSPGFSAAC